jgi:hypothetical protein
MIRTTQRWPRGFTSICTKASPIGQPFGLISMCRGGSHSSMVVSSSMTAGHDPKES